MVSADEFLIMGVLGALVAGIIVFLIGLWYTPELLALKPTLGGKVPSKGNA